MILTEYNWHKFYHGIILWLITRSVNWYRIVPLLKFFTIWLLDLSINWIYRVTYSTSFFFDSRQILVTVPQCLEILFLSPRRQDWTKKVRYVIFDEVKELRTFLTVIFAKLLLILCNEVAAWKRQNQRQKVTTIFTLCSFASFNNVVISLILKLCN